MAGEVQQLHLEFGWHIRLHDLRTFRPLYRHAAPVTTLLLRHHADRVSLEYQAQPDQGPL